MRRAYVSVLGAYGFYRLAYKEWGAADNPRVLLCVHGLTRNSGDFDLLAEELADRYRVVAVDLPGRGDSDWLPVKTDYVIPTYMNACATLIARLGVEKVDWLGTSLGGLIGMSLAATPGNAIARLVLNDVGPVLPATALQRIVSFVGTDPRFPDLAAVETYLKVALMNFGVRDPAHWHHMAEISSRPVGDGTLRLHYDPGIVQAFADPVALQNGVNIWPLWDMIRCPTLLLRGANSDLLTAEDAAAMTQRGPKPELVEFPDCGHAPALMDIGQIAVVKNWLG